MLPFKPVFGPADVEILERKTAWKRFFRMDKLVLSHRLFQGGATEPFERELFVRGNSVGVLLYDPEKKLIGLVEQFRIGALDEPLGPWILEVVAGMVEKGDDPRQTALNELAEETGIADVQLHPICDYLVSPGGTNEKVFLFCGIASLEGKQGVFGKADENEDIRLHILPEEEVFSALQNGNFNNAATTIALLWLKLHRTEFL